MRKFITLLTAVLVLVACKDEDEPDNFEPQLYVGEAVDITRTEATLTGRVVTNGSASVPELRFIYGVQGDFSMTSPPVTADGQGQVAYRLTGLEAGTAYNFYLQGNNGRVTLTSETATFTTDPNDKPTVGTPVLLSQGPSSLIASYEILSDGGEEITETGCYVCDLTSGEETRMPASFHEDSVWRIRVSGLELDRAYRIQSYAVNRVGESKGGTLEVETGEAVMLTGAGELSELLGDDLYRFTSLSFTGPMNGDDLRVLRQMMGRALDGSETSGQLTEVDLTDASIVSGGGSYDNSRFTEDDKVSQGLFADCGRLENVSLPSAAKVIEKDAFLNCSSLRRLEIPAEAVEVSPSAGCDRLEELSISAVNPNYRSVDGVLFNAEVSQIVWFPMAKDGDYVLPTTMTAIGDYAFSGCHITKFTLPEGLKELGQGVFYGSAVEEAVTPSTLRMLPTATFQACRQLKTVRLGSGMELISDYAFDGCPLEHIYVESTYPPVCNPDAFTNSYEDLYTNCVLHVPSNTLGMYKSDPAWGKFDQITAM